MRLTEEQRRSLEERTSRHQKNLDTARDYLESRGFVEQTAVSFRLGVVDELSEEDTDSRILGRLSIPYLTRAGVVDLRYRCLRPHSCSSDGCPKYLGSAGTDTRLFNVASLFGGRPTVAVAEGELDAVTLVQCGIPAVAVPGVGNWKPHFDKLFDDFTKVYVYADGDDQGRKFAERLGERLPNLITVQMPDGMDVNSVMCDTRYGEEFLRGRVG